LTVAARALIGKQITRVAIEQHDSFGSDASSGIHPTEELVRNPTSNQTVGFAVRAPAALFLDQRERPWRQTAREHGRCSSYSGRDRQHIYDRLLKSGERPLLYSRDDGQCTRRHPTILPTEPRYTHSRTPRRPQESRSVDRLVDAMCHNRTHAVRQSLYTGCLTTTTMASPAASNRSWWVARLVNPPASFPARSCRRSAQLAPEVGIVDRVGH
jgi:hypothetical protein